MNRAQGTAAAPPEQSANTHRDTSQPATSGASVVVLYPELYRIRDAAAVLGVSSRLVYSFIERGELVPVRLPTTGTKRGPVRIARADILAFVARYRGSTA